MPIFVTGQMWDELPVVDVFCITTNSTITNPDTAPRLVMGAGIAKQCAMLWPKVPGLFADLILAKCGQMGVYGMLSIPMTYHGRPFKLAAFQVKTYWGNDASYELIGISVEKLGEVARKYPDKCFCLNFPGIGNGRLDRGAVMTLLVELPDNVYIFEI